MCSSASGSTSRARRNSRSARRSTATNSWLRSTRAGISIRNSGANTASIAACAGYGRARTTRPEGSCTSRAAPSTGAGCSITTKPPKRTTKPAIASATTCFARANTSRSVTRMATCTRFRWSRSSRPPESCGREPMHGNDGSRTAAEVLIDQLVVHGTRHVFCVPGESYIAALDALHDRDIAVTECRHERGAAIMAEACGKATGRPGTCSVTRGPGATNAAAGLHIARQDSTPLILFVGQIAREMREREAFQELDYRAVFGSIVKWATEIDDPTRVPELISRAFYTATSGRPGPVVIALPEDMLVARVGGRLGEQPSQGYTLLGIPGPRQTLVHVFPGVEELGRVYHPHLAINASPTAFAAALEGLQPPTVLPWRADTPVAHADFLAWTDEAT